MSTSPVPNSWRISSTMTFGRIYQNSISHLKVTITSLQLLCDNKEDWKIVLIVVVTWPWDLPLGDWLLVFPMFFLMSHSSKSDWWHTLSSILSIFDPCRLGLWFDWIFPIGTSSNMGQHPYVWTLALSILCFPRVLESKHFYGPLAPSYISSGDFMPGRFSSCPAISLRMSYLLQIGIQPSSLHLLRCSHGRWGFLSDQMPHDMCTTSIFPKGNLPKRLGWMDLYTEFERSMLWLFRS